MPEALEVDAVLAEGGEEHGEGELDGVGVFEGGEAELEGGAGFGEVVGEDGLALEFFGGEVHGVEDVFGAVVGRVEGAEVGVDALVVVAEGLAAEGEALAAAAAGTDVSAVDGWHGFLLLAWGYPPQVSLSGSKWFVLLGLAEALAFKRLKTKNLRSIYFIPRNLAVLVAGKAKGLHAAIAGCSPLGVLFFLRLAKWRG